MENVIATVYSAYDSQTNRRTFSMHPFPKSYQVGYWTKSEYDGQIFVRYHEMWQDGYRQAQPSDRWLNANAPKEAELHLTYVRN